MTPIEAMTIFFRIFIYPGYISPKSTVNRIMNEMTVDSRNFLSSNNWLVLVFFETNAPILRRQFWTHQMPDSLDQSYDLFIVL